MDAPQQDSVAPAAPGPGLSRRRSVARLLLDLRRRPVFRALLAYGVVAVTVLRVVEPALHGLGLPEWTFTVVVIAFALGFPATVGLAWILEDARRRAEPTMEGAGRWGPRRRWSALLAVALALAAAPGLAWYFLGRPSSRWSTGGAVQQRASIAVLPFADMSRQHDQEYFADGLTEELADALAQVEGLRVIGRTSSFAFKGRNEDLRVIGQKLGVSAVLEGSVRMSGDRVRISAQLVNVADGTRLWSQEFDRELRDVFAVQDEIATLAVAALETRLLRANGGSARARGTASAEAHNDLLLGDQLVSRGTLEDFRRAVTAYEKALAIDPGYAVSAAHLALALNYIWGMAGNDAGAGLADVEQRARAAAEKAIALGPGLPDAYLARARIRSLSWDWPGAGADIDRVLALDPANVRGLEQRANLLAASGRLAAAIAVQRKIVDLDPLNESSWNALGWYYLGSGDVEQARSALRRALEIAPDSAYATGNLAISFLIAGDPATALETWRRCNEERFRLLGMALAEHDLGHAGASDAALDNLRSRFPELPFRVAEVHAWRGDADAAFEWLDRAVAKRDTSMRYLAEDPLLRKIRSDPRYASLLQRLHLRVF